MQALIPAMQTPAGILGIIAFGCITVAAVAATTLPPKERTVPGKRKTPSSRTPAPSNRQYRRQAGDQPEPASNAPDATEQAALQGCDRCRLARAEELARLAITAAGTSHNALPSPLQRLASEIDRRLQTASEAAARGQWQEAALRTRDANNLLAGAIQSAYRDPDGPPGQVLMPHSAARAMTALSAATEPLIHLGLLQEVPHPTDKRATLDAAISTAMAAAQRCEEHEAEILRIATCGCTHPEQTRNTG